ncbi:MAG: EAL domain-containing protein [Gammaproteobacteria bacterium]|nr:EAL domain-containing protein [Gammaproteobacteria bacterium]MDH3432318.1 EAL domain-containing protein [Gammaproteobacteria bacterium]
MSHPDQPQETGRALVITSDNAISRRLSKLLEAEGYDAVDCLDLGQASDSAADSAPALIVVDAAIDPQNSLAACQAIRQLPGCNYVPLLLLSDDCDSAAIQQAYEENVTAVVEKPIDEQVFKKHIRSLGDTGRTLSGIRALRTPESDVLHSMPDAFFVAGKDGLLRQYLGGANDDPVLSPEDIEGQLITDVWPADVAKIVLQNIKRVLRSREGYAFEVELSGNDMSNRYEVRLLVQGRDRVLMIMRNIPDLHGRSGGPQNRNAADTLTGLTAAEVFRTDFDTMIDDAKLRERGIAVFCIDIDRFTRINTTLGRAVGDAVLKVTAQRIERCLRSTDQLARIDDPDGSSLTRISGDEFVLVLADIESRDDVDTVAGRVREAFTEPVSIEGHKLQITPSIGISLYPLDGKNAEALLKNARVALDEAKVLSVDGREFYSGTMQFRALKRLDVKNELRWAIEKEQLELHYLPRIDLTTGHVAGLEALLRWMHPLRGSVPLQEVIPLAEATGLIYPIGEWVLASACQQANEWYIEDLNVPPVSINLSQQEFTRDDLATLISLALEDAGLPSSQLELEITEAMLMRSRQADVALRELSKIGVGIVLDDFGQGHSSIARLTSLPIKAIKIDRTFIDGVREPGQKQAICSAIIAMSRELGITVIAEGVESQLQVEFLRERGCDAVQGFLYTEPLRAEEVPAFLIACKEVADESMVINLDTVRHQIEIKTAS